MNRAHARMIAAALLPCAPLVHALALGTPSALADEPRSEAPRVTLTAEVATFRNQRGALGCRLYATGAGFPEKGPFVAEQRVDVRGRTASCVFRDLPAGRYAVSVMHDENGNRKLDTNFLGVPTEGYGVSNNKTYALSAPKWEESTFAVGKEDVTLRIALRY